MSDSLRRADADDAPDGAGPRGPLDAERRALTPEETANIAAMSTGRTHFDGCWQHTTHGDCARARVQQLEEALAARDAELGRAGLRIVQLEARLKRAWVKCPACVSGAVFDADEEEGNCSLCGATGYLPATAPEVEDDD
jgi:hypothetical protein